MKRSSKFRERLLLSEPKRKKLQILLDELTKPEIDVSKISKHTTMVFSHMQNQNVMMVPQLIRQIRKQNEPIVLEITKSMKPEDEVIEAPFSLVRNDGVPEEVSIPEPSTVVAVAENSDVAAESYAPLNGEASNVGMEGTGGIDLEQGVRDVGEKQFEIIFSDSARPNDGDSEHENHIIHSTTECTTGATAEIPGTVNVPNSFPLFQIVHTGEVPEDVQHEIVRLIRQANPELDLNSITFKFKSPETVEIIANINS